MPGPRKVLFMSAPIGSGHIRAAQAVAQALTDISPEVQVGFANVFDFFSPRLGNSILKTYLKILNIFPQAYGMAYGWGNSSKVAMAGRELISGYLGGRMQKYIETFQPDAIVCTHATPAGLCAHLVRNGRLSIPVFAVVTDYVVHRLWVYPEISRYFVAAEQLSDYLADNGVARSRCIATGIPADARFTSRLEQASLLDSFGLQREIKTVLIMGGGAGVLPMDKIAVELDGLRRPLQLIAVAGRNAEMHGSLKKLQHQLSHCTLRPLGFVDNVHELMAAADFVITKPGGMTVTEALCQGLPLVIYRPIPGQEEANTSFLLQHGLGRRAETLAELSQIVSELLSDTASLTDLRQKVLSVARPGAAASIAKHVAAAIG